MDSATLGITAIIIGLALFGLVSVLLRAASRMLNVSPKTITPALQATLPGNQQAVLIIQTGGKIVYLNSLAREWFDLDGEEYPNIERMARTTRPVESFLGLCSTPGQTRFNLQQTLIDGTSYVIPYQGERAIVVTLKQPKLTSLQDGAGESSSQALNIFTEISQSMSSSLDLETTITSILNSIESLVHSDLSEITLVEPDKNIASAYRYMLDERGIQRLEKNAKPEKEIEISRYIINQDKPVLIENMLAFSRTQSGAFQPRPPYLSLLGIPLKVGGDSIGSLELYSQSEDAFDHNAKDILDLLSGHAAVALQNARKHYSEQQRGIELSGLANLSQIGSSLFEGRELYQRLLDAIAPLISVDILGFLILNENLRVLEGKNPFLGMPTQFVELYRVQLDENSPAEEVWKSQKIIQTNDVNNHPGLKNLELSALAVAAGIRDTIMVPLVAGGRSLGFLQAANKTNGEPLDEDDMRLLQIIAGQVAPILENASLIQDSRRRAQRSETLRRVASLAGSSATLDEVLKFSAVELSRFFQADQVAIFLLNENMGEMELHIDSAIGISQETIEVVRQIPIQMVNFSESVTSTTFPLLVENIQIDQIPGYYKNLATQFKDMHSAMIAPLLIKERGVGEIILGNRKNNFYNHNDILSLTSAASQLASALDRSSLSAQTDESLQRRVDQLTALTRVSREINSTTDLEHLLQQVYDEAVRTTNAYGGKILLLDGNTGDQITSENISLALGAQQDSPISDLERKVLESGKPEVIHDFNKSHHQASQDGIFSALVMPIAHLGKTVGLIHLYGKKIGQFDKVSQEITQVLAIHAAIAIGNAQRYQEQTHQSEKLNRRVETLSNLFNASQSIQLDMPLPESLSKMADGILGSNDFEIVLIYVNDPVTGMLKAQAGAGLPEDVLSRVNETEFPWEHIDQLMQPIYQRGKSFFIPYQEISQIPSLVPEYAYLSYTIPEETEDAWQPGDRLILPLFSSTNEPLGVIAVDAPREGLRPDSISIENLELFAAETTMLIESAHKFDSIKTELNSDSVSYTNGIEQSGLVPQEFLSNLLHKDLEQTIAIQQLHNRAQNIRVGLDIAEKVNRQPDRESVLNSLATQIVTHLDLDAAIIAEPTPNGGPRLLQQLGALPEIANLQALLGQRNPLKQAILDGESIIVPNLEENSTWRDSPLLKNIHAKAFIILPITSNGVVDSVVLATSQSTIANFTKEDEQIYELIAKQVSITLQNLNLLTETRRRLREVNLLLDFSRQLGSLDSSEILKSLVSSIRRVMSHAHGTMISLWDAEQKALVTQAASGYSENDLIAEISFRPGEGLPGKVYLEGTPRRVDEVDFVNQYNLSPENLIRYRQATGGRVPVSSMLIPIQTGDSILGVITLDNFNTTAAFNEEDMALVSSLSQQTALTLENARLFDQSRQLNEELEQRVDERTEQLAYEHRFSQTLLKISTELSSSLDLDHVLNQTLEMLNQTTGAEQSSIMLLRPGEPHYFYRAGVGIAMSPPMGGRPSSLEVGEGLIGQVIKERKGLVISDLFTEQSWVSHTRQTSLHRSAIVAPLIVGADALGALMMYHRQPGHFTENQMDAIQAAANQFAVTINNGELFRLIRDQAEDLGNMLRVQQIEASRSTAMLEGVADGVLVTDNNNVITLFNDSAVKILELSQEQVVEKTLDDFIGLFGGVARSWIETIQNWSNNPQDLAPGVVYSEQINLEDGRVVSVHLSPVSDSKEFLGTVSVFRDITHEIEVDRLKSEFVATVSHELRTPMTPIKGYVEFLIMGGAGELNEQQSEFLSIIKSNIDRLSILVNDLLDVSRIEAGKVALSFQPIDIIGVTKEAIETILQKSRDEEKIISIQINSPQDLPSIYGDLERIRQILSNLIDNAYKYSPENSNVTVNLEQQNGDIQVSVKDNGIGIFPEDQERVFERFYRGENHFVMATAGTGLGLPIVKELVEMHSGRIWVSSAGVPGQGSTFSFTIPIYQPGHEEDQATT